MNTNKSSKITIFAILSFFFLFIVLLSFVLGDITSSDTNATGMTDDLADGMTWNYDFTCGENMELIVGIAIDADIVSYVNSITYNGTNMGLVGRETSSDDEEQVEMWNLSNPDCGESLPVVVIFSDSGDREEAAGGSVIFYGVDSVNLSTVTKLGCAGASCTSSYISVPAAPDDVVVDVIAVDVDPLLSWGDNQTLLINYDAGVDSIGMSYGNVTGTSLGMSWAWSNDEHAHIGVALIPVIPSVIEWNQSSLNMGESVNNITSILKIDSTLTNTDVTITCTGNCTQITTNWTVRTMTDGQSDKVLITCSNATEGVFQAIFNVTSDEDTVDNLLTVDCEIFSYGWLNVSISKPDDNSNWYQEDANLTINTSVTCEGGSNARCGTVSALARYGTSTPDTTINITEGAIPFYVVGGEGGGGVFGCQTVGSGESGLENRISGGIYLASQSGNIESITASLVAWGATEAVKCAIYDENKDFINETEERTSGGADGWHTFNFDSPVPVISGTNYSLVCWAEAVVIINSEANVATNYWESSTYGTFPSTLGASTSTTEKSIYANYTSSASAENPQSKSLNQGEDWDVSWTLNVSSSSTESFLIDVLFNSSYGSTNISDNNTGDRTINLNPLAPRWSLNKTNSTIAGTTVLFSVLWDSSFQTQNLSSYIFSWHNGTNWTKTDNSGDKESGEQSFEASGGVAAISIYDDFETDFGNWTTHWGVFCPDLQAWGTRATSTPSADTGPQSGGVGGVGTYFIYVETSSAGCYETSNMAFVQLDQELDYEATNENFTFYFNAYGTDIDTLTLEENSTSSWVELWSMSDINNDFWNFTSVDLSSLTGTGLLRFKYTRTSTGALSDIALDRINITGDEGLSDVDSNKTAVEYSNVISNLYEMINNLTVVVNVSYYNNSGSINNSNSNVTLWLEVYNNTDWVDEGSFMVNETGNFSIVVTTASVMNAWKTEENRDIRISARLMDYNNSLYDKINWADAWISVDSHQEMLNDSPVSMIGGLNYSNVTKGLTSSVGAIIKWQVMANSSAGIWNTTSLFEFNTTTGVEGSKTYENATLGISINMVSDKKSDIFKTFPLSMLINNIFDKGGVFLKSIFNILSIDDIIKVTIGIPRIITQSLNIDQLASRFIGIPRIITQSLNINQLVSKFQVFLKSISQSLSINQLSSKFGDIFKSISQFLNINQLTSRIIGIPIKTSQSLNINQLTSRFISIPRNIYQSLNINQLTSKLGAFFKQTSQSLNINQLTSRFTGTPRSIYQSLNINQLTSRLGAFFKQTSQSININQLTSKFTGIPIKVSQSLNINQLMSRFTGIPRSIYQSLNINQLTSRLGAFFKQTSQSLSINQLSSKLGTIFRSIYQSLNINQLTSRLGAFFKQTSQSLNINQLTSRFIGIPRSIYQSLNINQLTSRFISIPRSIFQSLNINQLTSGVGSAAEKIVRAISQSLNINQLTSRLGAFFKQTSQSLNINQLASRFIGIPRNIYQSLNINQLTSRLGAFFKQTSQSLNVNQLTSRFTGIPIKVSQSLNINQLSSRFIGIPRNIYQSLNINQLTSKLGNFFKTTSQSLNINQLVSRFTGIPRSIYQSLNINQLASKLGAFFKQTSQSLNINQLTSKIIGIPIKISQFLNINQLTSRFISIPRSIYQSLNINQLASKLGNFFKQTSQSLNVNQLTSRFTGIPRNIYQSLNINQLASKLGDFFKQTSQSLNINQLTSRFIGIPRNIYQSLNINQLTSRFIGIPRNIYQSLNINQLTSRFIGIPRNIYQSLNVNQLTSRLGIFFKSVSQSLNINQLASRTTEVFGEIFRTISQSLNINQLTSRLGDFFKQTSQSLNINQLINRIIGIPRSIYQSLNINQLTSKFIGIPRSIYQSLNINQLTSKLGNFFKQTSQSLNINQLSSRFIGIPRSIYQSLNINQLTSKLGNFFKTVSQSININQLISKFTGIPIKVSQSLNINQLSSRFTGIPRSIYQSLNINQLASKLGNFFKTTSQSLNINQLASRFIGIPRSLYQSLNINQLTSRLGAFFKQTSQSLNINQLTSKLGNFFKQTSQSLNINQLSSRFIGIPRSIYQSLNINQLTSKLGNFFKTVSQSININQLISKFTGIPIKVSQSLNINQLSSRFTGIPRSIYQSLNINQLASKLGNFFKTTSQSLNINQLASRFIGIPRSLYQSLNINQLTSRLGAFFKQTSQSLNINQLASRFIGIPRSIYQSLNINQLTSKLGNFFKSVSQSLNINQLASKIVILFGETFRTISQSLNINQLTSKLGNFFKQTSQSLNINQLVSRFRGIFRNIFQGIVITINKTVLYIVATVTPAGGGGGGIPIPTEETILDIDIDVHYYIEGREIEFFYVSKELTYDAISFDIIGTNNENYNITNLIISEASPEIFKESFVYKMQSLSPEESKILWSSLPIKINEFEIGEDVIFYINVLKKESIMIRGNNSITITIGEFMEEDKPFFVIIGEKIYPGNPVRGLVIIFVVIISVGFILWRYNVKRRLIEWKEKIQKNRRNKYKYEEGI